MENNFVKISKVWTEDDVNNNPKLIDTFGELGFGFYILCRLNELTYTNCAKVSIGEFLDTFGFVAKSTRSRKRKELLDAILLMEQEKVLTFYSDLSFSNVVKFDKDTNINQILYCGVERFEDAKFIRLTRSEFCKIANSESNQLELLIHFITIMSFENNVKNICYPTLEGLSNITKYSPTTSVRYNDRLIELGVLYCNNGGMQFDDRDNTFKQMKNTYGRVCNKEFVDKYVEQSRLDVKGRIYNASGEKQKLNNLSRSLKMKARYAKSEEDRVVYLQRWEDVQQKKQEMDDINYRNCAYGVDSN